jgi:MFS family permease
MASHAQSTIDAAAVRWFAGASSTMHSSPVDTHQRPPAAMLVLLASLYCAQGLPSGLFAHSLPVLLRQHGVDLALIGLLKLLALPWMLKVLWAPWVDRIASHRFGRHRGWILPLQTSVILCVAGLALFEPSALFGTQWPVLIGLVLLINLAAATQDIATDGLTVRLLSERWRGLGNGVQVGGYKLGMIISGSGLLFAMDSLGWNVSLALIAGLLLMCTLPIWRFPERQLIPHQPAAAERALGPGLLWAHYRGLLAQPGMLAWMAVVLSFKLGDALGSPMVKPMLVDQGWSNAALGQLTLISSVAGIGGALLGGALYARLGAKRSLMLFGALQALGMAALALLVARGGDTGLVYLVTLAEQAADGMSTVALFAVMMQRCRPEHEGADFTFQASAQALLAGIVGSASGLLAQSLGYPALFAGAGVLGALVLTLVARYFSRFPSAPR